MSKAILVVDMPSGCVKCPLYDYVPSRCFTNGKFQNDISEDFKPDWCPLKSMPEKDNESYFPDEYSDGHRDGYNACIDEILRKEVARFIDKNITKH